MTIDDIKPTHACIACEREFVMEFKCPDCFTTKTVMPIRVARAWLRGQQWAINYVKGL